MSAAMLRTARREVERERSSAPEPVGFEAVVRTGSVPAFRIDQRFLDALGVDQGWFARAVDRDTGACPGSTDRDRFGTRTAKGLGSGSDSGSGNPSCECESSCSCTEVVEYARKSLPEEVCGGCVVLACYPREDIPGWCRCLYRCDVRYHQGGTPGLYGCWGEVEITSGGPACGASGGKTGVACDDNDGCPGSSPPDVGQGSLVLPGAAEVSDYAENLDIVVGLSCRGAEWADRPEYKDAVSNAWAMLRANLDLAEYAACVVGGMDAATCLTSIAEGEIVKIQVEMVEERKGRYFPGWTPSVPHFFGGMRFGEPPVNLSCLQGGPLSDAVNEAGTGSQYTALSDLAVVIMHELMHLCVPVSANVDVGESACDTPSRTSALFKKLLNARLQSAGLV